MSEIKSDSIKLVKYFAVEYTQIVDCIKEIYVYEFNGHYWITNVRNNSGALRLIPKEQVVEIFKKETDELLKALYDTEIGIKEVKTIKLLI